MGRNEVPGFFERRDLLAADQPNTAALRAQAETFLTVGLLDSAIESFRKAEDAAGLEKVLDAARREGDAFSFEAALRALDRSVAHEEWARIGETALGAGRLWFAYRAFEKADNQAGLERTRREMAAAGIQPPQ